MLKIIKLLFLGAAVAFGPTVWGQTDAAPIKFIVPYTAGGTNDIIARTVAASMARSMDRSVVVENKPGASGGIAAAFVAKSLPDGKTVLIAPSNILVINQWVYQDLLYDTQRDFAPITLAGFVPGMLIVNNDLPVKNVKELIQYAKSHPNKLSFASFGVGTTGHLSGEMLKIMANVEMTHIPYAGSAPALSNLLGGHVDLMFDNMPTALPLAKEGKVRSLAVASLQRSDLAPDVPTLDESGLNGFDVTPWFAFVAPAATPKHITEELNREIVKTLKSEHVSSALSQRGVRVIGNTTEELRQFIATESEKWHAVVKKSGIVKATPKKP